MKALPVAKAPKQKRDAEETRRSAKALAHLVVAAKDVSLAHKKGVLHYVIWKITEAEHVKHKLPLRSRKAHEEVLRGGNLGKRLRHEHVFPRKELVEHLLKRGADVSKLLDTRAIACVVTVEEAKKLNKKNGEGWLRYDDIPVVLIEKNGNARRYYPKNP